MRRTIENEYYDWLCRMVCGQDRFRIRSYRKLLTTLHEREFTWIIHNDENRAEEGVNLRYRFASDMDYNASDVFIRMTQPCSVLEMMTALAIRCEESIMSDPQYGDRTTQWFWGMIRSLGLNGMHDDWFDYDRTHGIINMFLNRHYAPNGAGGLFVVKNTTSDLRDVEIWHQLCWYLDILEGY